MKKLLLGLVFLCGIVVSIFGCANNKNVGTITLSSSQYEMFLYEAFILNAESDDFDTFTWSNSDDTVIEMVVASDEKSATINGLKEGNATIKVSSGKASATCVVTIVLSQDVPVLSTNNSTVELVSGSDFTIISTLKYGETFLAATYTYESQDIATATVSQTGVVTGVKAGSTRIAVLGSYLGYKNTVYVDVTVNPLIIVKTSTKNVSIFEQSDKAAYPSIQDVSAKAYADTQEIVSAELSWEIADTDIAKYENGTISAISIGSTELKITYTKDGKDYYETVFINVFKIPDIEVKLSKTDILLYEQTVLLSYSNNEELQVTVSIDSKPVDNPDIIWESENSLVAIYENGFVKGIGKGVTNITAKFMYEGVPNTASVSVTMKSVLQYGESAKLSGVEGLMVDMKQGHQFYYDKVIDISDNTKTDALIKLEVLPNMVGAIDGDNIVIKLEEANNPSNYVEITLNYNNYHNPIVLGSWNDITYVTAGFAGVAQKGWGSGTLYTKASSYGTGATFSYAGGYLTRTENNGISIAYDYATNAIYVINNVNRAGVKSDLKVIDLDDDLGAAWSGFSSGLVKLSIYAEVHKTNVSLNYIIDQIDGHDVLADEASLLPKS